MSMTPRARTIELTEIYNQFAFDLYKVIGYGKRQNVILSPFCIISALNVCYTGAKNTTERQLAQLLNYISLSKDQVNSESLKLANYLQSLKANVEFYHGNRLYKRSFTKINKEFSEIIHKTYNTDIEFIDYCDLKASAKRMNDWIEEQTNHKIKESINEYILNGSISLLLLNCVYFKGIWAAKFNKNATSKQSFHLPDGTVKLVDMMMKTNQKLKYIRDLKYLNAAICELPYLGDQISMTVILPHEGVNISSVENILNAAILKAMLETNIYEVKVSVMLPRFKIQQSLELSGTIGKMGIQDLFIEGKADLSGIGEKDRAFLSKIVYRAAVEVTEEGDEVVASGGNVLKMLTQPAVVSRPFIFKCDRPFLFFIHDTKTNMILFFGKYIEPAD